MLSMGVILSSSLVDWDHLQVCSIENIPKQQELSLLKCVSYQEAATGTSSLKCVSYQKAAPVHAK